MKNLALLDVFRMASIPSSSIQAFSTPAFRSEPPHKRHDNDVRSAQRAQSQFICFFLCVFSTMTAPVLELSCDVTPTSKVAKTGEWSLEKMSSVQPGAKTNLFFWRKYCVSWQDQRETFHKKRKRNNQASDRGLSAITGNECSSMADCEPWLWVVAFFRGCFYFTMKMKINTVHFVSCGLVGAFNQVCTFHSVVLTISCAEDVCVWVGLPENPVTPRWNIDLHL